MHALMESGRTGSQDRVASLTPILDSSLYFSARRPISVVHTGCTCRANTSQL